MVEEQKEAPAGGTLPFHYIKSNLFRVIHVDGAIGGPNPRDVIQAALYTERLPIPQRTVSRITAEGTLAEELPEQRVVRDGLVREVEIELIFDPATGKLFAQWLLDSIAKMENPGAKS